MRKENVVTIPKKGSKLKLDNERGIFLLNNVRGIVMRLIFNLKYDMFDFKCLTVMWEEEEKKWHQLHLDNEQCNQ